MTSITLVGIGKIGALAAILLKSSRQYQIQLLDQHLDGPEAQRLFTLYPKLRASAKAVDVADANALEQAIHEFKTEAIVSCLPFFLTLRLAQLAKKLSCHYFDLTEDVRTVAAIKALAQNAKQAFVSHCGLAPGMTGIIAADLMQQFTEIDSAFIRVGALPEVTSSSLKYALSWSTDGLINEYDNPCVTIYDRQLTTRPPLEDLEVLQIHGELYEAFNTSGGLGSLCEIYQNKLRFLNYKTIRYPGHCDKMKFLLQDLKLRDNKALLKQILENALPRTVQDFVIIVIEIKGMREGQTQTQIYSKKIHAVDLQGYHWTAIQIATASGICAVIDVVLKHASRYQGFVQQETISMNEILKTPYGHYYGL